MRTIFLRIAFVAGIFIASCHGQARWDDVNFKTASIGGVHLYGVSVFSGYTTLALPTNSLQQVVTPGLTNLGGDTNYGAEWALGWRRSRDNSDISARYSGTYNGQTRYSNLNAFGHSISLGASRTYHTKWSFNLSANAQYTTLAQYLFQPSALSTISQIPATFDDLAAAFAIGSFSNTQVASMLTGTPIAPTVDRSLLLGDRILTYGVQASASYAPSERLSISFSSFSAGGQSRVENKQSVVNPNSIGAPAGVSLNYNLSPRTSVGLNLSATRTSDRYQGSYGTGATGTLGRKMGPHWFLSVGGGMSYINVIRQISGPPPGSRQVTAMGSLGYRTYSHTLMASYNRGTYDTYGLAVGVNTNALGAWTWHRPGTAWTLIAGFGRQQLRNTGFTTISGWQANAGASRNLTTQVSLRAEYVYFDTAGSFLGNSLNQTVHSVRVSLSWSPQEVAK